MCHVEPVPYIATLLSPLLANFNVTYPNSAKIIRWVVATIGEYSLHQEASTKTPQPAEITGK
jgi:hypothetical protein